MKKFVLKTLLYLSPFLLMGIAQGFLPITSFTHKLYESLFFKSDFVPHFTSMYPNQEEKNYVGYGDLCYNTKYAIPKDESFKTDSIGYRNDKFIKNPDVLIIGDSYSLGCTMNQQNLIAKKIMEQTGNKLKVYAMAPATFSDFDRYLKLGIIQKPKTIIYERVERGAVDSIVYYKNDYKDKLALKSQKFWGYRNANIFLDKIFRNYLGNTAKSKILGRKGTGKQSKVDDRLFFYDTTIPEDRNPKFLGDNIKHILEYKRYCDSLGVKLVYLPMPNKESVYYDKIPIAEQPKYLSKFKSLLDENNISNINTLEIYNNFRKTSNTMLYNYDDTHWNVVAVDLMSKEILKFLKQNQK